MAFDSRVLDIAEEEEEKMFKFAISLLGTIIQDDGMKERSNNLDLIIRLRKVQIIYLFLNTKYYC